MNFIEYRQLTQTVNDYKEDGLARAIQYIKSVRGVFRIELGDKPRQYSASLGERIRVSHGEVVVSLTANNNMSSIEAGVPLRVVEIEDGGLSELQRNEEQLEMFRKEFINLAQTHIDNGDFAGVPKDASIFFYDDTQIGIIEPHGISYEKIPSWLLTENVSL